MDLIGILSSKFYIFSLILGKYEKIVFDVFMLFVDEMISINIK